MAQLNFHCNYPVAQNNLEVRAASHATLSFFPITPSDSISWGTLNFLVNIGNGSKTISVGLYSLNGSTLSLANSISGSVGAAIVEGYLSITDISAAQNITPGNWWLGFVISTSGTSNFNLMGNTSLAPGNAFPGGFVQGRMTASTNALPSSQATSDLDITGNDAFFTPIMILTA